MVSRLNPADPQLYNYATVILARQGEIHSRAIGPLVTNPPKPTRILHSDAYMKYMEGLDGGKPLASKWDKMIASVHPQRAETMVRILFKHFYFSVVKTQF